MTEATTTTEVSAKTFDLSSLTGVALTKKVEQLGKERTKITARLEEIEAILPELKARADAEYEEQQRLAAIETVGLAIGTTVDADYGRGEKRRTVRGYVLAFQAKTENTPALYAIQTGTGLDTQVVKVPAVAVKVAV